MFTSQKYTERILWLSTISFLLLIFFESDLFFDLLLFRNAGGSQIGLFQLALVVIMILGMGLSFYHAFSHKVKSFFSLYLMGSYFALVTGVAGIYVTVDVLGKSTHLYMLIFAIVNILNSLWLLIRLTQTYSVTLDIDHIIADYDMTRNDRILFGALAIILTVSGVLLGYPWFYTYTFVMSVGLLLESIMPVRKSVEKQTSSRVHHL